MEIISTIFDFIYNLSISYRKSFRNGLCLHSYEVTNFHPYLLITYLPSVVQLIDKRATAQVGLTEQGDCSRAPVAWALG